MAPNVHKCYFSNYYLPQSAQTFDFELKSCFVLLNTSSRSSRCWLASVSHFAALVCSTPRVDQLVVDLSGQSRQSVSTFRALCWKLDSLCFLFSCPWWLSKYCYSRRTGPCKLVFHSPKLLSIQPFSHRFEFGLILSSCFLYICYCFRETFAQYTTSARRHKKDHVPYYVYMCIYINIYIYI